MKKKRAWARIKSLTGIESIHDLRAVVAHFLAVEKMWADVSTAVEVKGEFVNLLRIQREEMLDDVKARIAVSQVAPRGSKGLHLIQSELPGDCVSR